MFSKFVLYGQKMGSNVLPYSSIGSILLARAAIRYFWVLNSLGASSPTDPEFVYERPWCPEEEIQTGQKGLPFEC